MLISFFSFSFRFFRCFYWKVVKNLNFFCVLDSWRAVWSAALVIELPNRIVYDGCTGARQCVEIGKVLK